MIIVQKYGGSSVATLEHIKAVAEFIKLSKTKDNSIVVVVSAMGKTTNTLLNQVKTLSALPPLREVDQLLATGELQSVSLLSMYLNEIGVPSISLSGRQAGIITNANFGKAFITKIKTSKILNILNQGKVAIVAGFQGVTRAGDTTTLGRGGSDTTAVALASALKGRCEIYSDIDCLYACDPRYCLNPKPIPKIDYSFTMEMAFNGAKALETRAVELAKKYNTPIYTGKSLRINKEKGTIVLNKKIDFESVKIINLSVKNQILYVKLNIFNKNKAKNKLFEYFSKYSLPLEMFSKIKNDNQESYSFCLDENTYLMYKDKFIECGKLEIKPCAKLSLIGAGLATHSEVLVSSLNLLEKNNINVHAISVSELTISLLIDEIQLQKAVDLLVDKFELGSN